MADPLHPIVNLLREQGRLDDLQVEEIVQENAKSGKPVQQIIADAGYVSMPELLRAIADHLGTEVVEISEADLNKEIIESIQLLLNAGLNINASESNGRTAAHGAALWGVTDVIKFLHSKGANLAQKDKRGLSALDTAMGKAGGFGFDGRSGVERPETVKAIRELLGPEAAEAAINKAPPAAEPDRARQRQLNGETGDQ